MEQGDRHGARIATSPEFPLVIFGDFICPWSYAIVELVDRLAEKHLLRPWWRPHSLWPSAPPEGLEYPDGKRRDTVKAWLREIAPEASRRMRFPNRIPHSFLAFQGLEFADDFGMGWEYARAVFDALWIDGADIASCETLHLAADRAGLDADLLGAGLLSGKYVDRANAAVQQARSLGISATPTMIIGRIRVDGWHYYEALESIVMKQIE